MIVPVIVFGHSVGETDSTVVVWCGQVSRFRDWDDVGQGPLDGHVVRHQAHIAELKHYYIKLTVSQHFRGK